LKGWSSFLSIGKERSGLGILNPMPLNGEKGQPLKKRVCRGEETRGRERVSQVLFEGGSSFEGGGGVDFFYIAMERLGDWQEGGGGSMRIRDDGEHRRAL